MYIFVLKSIDVYICPKIYLANYWPKLLWLFLLYTFYDYAYLIKLLNNSVFKKFPKPLCFSVYDLK